MAAAQPSCPAGGYPRAPKSVVYVAAGMPSGRRTGAPGAMPIPIWRNRPVRMLWRWAAECIHARTVWRGVARLPAPHARFSPSIQPRALDRYAVLRTRPTSVEPWGETWLKKSSRTIAHEYALAALRRLRLARRRRRPCTRRCWLSRHSVAWRAWTTVAAVGTASPPGQGEAEAGAGAAASAAASAAAPMACERVSISTPGRREGESGRPMRRPVAHVVGRPLRTLQSGLELRGRLLEALGLQRRTLWGRRGVAQPG